jgi:hypothetical protein
MPEVNLPTAYLRDFPEYSGTSLDRILTVDVQASCNSHKARCLAGAGLATIMIGAVVVTIQAIGVPMARLPSVTGALALLWPTGIGEWRRWCAAPNSTSAKYAFLMSSRSSALLANF